MKNEKIRTVRLGAVLLVGVMLITAGGCTTGTTKNNDTASTNDSTTVTTTLNPAIAAAAQEALKFYQSVTLDQPRAQLETMLAVPGEVQADGRVAYRDPVSGYGVLIKYGEDDKVFAKRLIPTAKAPELAALNPVPVTDKQAYRMAVGMPFYEVQDVMGSDGIEISLSKPETGDPKQVTGLGWFNPDGSYAVVYLNLPQGLVVGSEFVAV
ncbi:hypothetical protein GH811_04755 [Acetobacterium malicum]|uniref:PepSY domain-containing protein n=1 Tax=Acetobacterium malicum TaxID=52692 RepID=A0ABR6YUQ3_9FIRM|nr:hypothetical protein [Acetobacterium malicum]MBC3898922.1 hypothetical protein [Acetobacterium malicum]